MARDLMAAADGLERRHLAGAQLGRLGAARAEGAARWRPQGRRQVARQHDAPSAATLFAVRGRIRLQAGEREWPLEAGQLIPIPPQRHSVHADTDAAFLLTVALH